MPCCASPRARRSGVWSECADGRTACVCAIPLIHTSQGNGKLSNTHINNDNDYDKIYV